MRLMRLPFFKILVVTTLIICASCSANKKQPTSDEILKQLYGSRSNEETARIWFAAFIDENGNQHEPSFVNTVIKTANWEVKNVE